MVDQLSILYQIFNYYHVVFRFASKKCLSGENEQPTEAHQKGLILKLYYNKNDEL